MRLFGQKKANLDGVHGERAAVVLVDGSLRATDTDTGTGTCAKTRLAIDK